MVCLSMAIRTLASEQTPDAGSAWPMFDLTDPMSRGVSGDRLEQKIWQMAFAS